jgi:hypothetical protein
MNETYVEVLVKKKDSFGGKLIRTILVTLTVFFVILGVTVTSLSFLVALILGGLAYLANIKTKLEFEYLYVDKEITIDKIFARTKRKRVARIEMERVEIIAPINSYHLDSYKNRTMKPTDYSSGTIQQPEKRYVIYYNGVSKYIFEPTPAMIKAMQMVAPRKVFAD